MSNNLPQISIIVPSYNQSAYLGETLQALIQQSYPNLQIIVIDGGSHDESVAVIQQYDPFIHYWVSEQDAGQSDAICKGFARATGEIITFCNSDDYYLPDTLVDVAKAYQANPNCGVIVGGFQYVDAKSDPLGGTHWPQLTVETPYDLSLGPPGIYRLHQAAAFFTRHALDNVGRYVRQDLTYTMDRELLYRVCRRYPIVTRQKLYAAFRLHEASKSVADQSPFADEFAHLYRSLKTGNQEEDRRREQMARYHLAKGHIKVAKTSSDWKTRTSQMIQAGRIYPHYLVSKQYYYAWYLLLRKHLAIRLI